MMQVKQNTKHTQLFSTVKPSYEELLENKNSTPLGESLKIFSVCAVHSVFVFFPVKLS